MSESRHTPGPWRPTTTHGDGSNEPFMVWCDGRGAAIAHVYSRSESGAANIGEQASNARLIAAAPDLLAACEAVAQQLADIHAAIADLGLTARFVDDSINMLSEGQTAIESARAAIAKARCA